MSDALRIAARDLAALAAELNSPAGELLAQALDPQGPDLTAIAR
jgi:hypothetical protein